jgi:hypothetical protein
MKTLPFRLKTFILNAECLLRSWGNLLRLWNWGNLRLRNWGNPLGSPNPLMEEALETRSGSIPATTLFSPANHLLMYRL